MWFIGVEVEQETSAPPPKKSPGSAPERRRCFGTVATVFFSKRIKTGRTYRSLNNSRIRTTSLCRLYLRVYDIAHHAQFVQTVTGSRRALSRARRYVTVIHVSNCYVCLFERQWGVCLYQFGSFHRRRRYRTK